MHFIFDIMKLFPKQKNCFDKTNVTHGFTSIIHHRNIHYIDIPKELAKVLARKRGIFKFIVGNGIVLRNTKLYFQHFAAKQNSKSFMPSKVIPPNSIICLINSAKFGGKTRDYFNDSCYVECFVKFRTIFILFVAKHKYQIFLNTSQIPTIACTGAIFTQTYEVCHFIYPN